MGAGMKWKQIRVSVPLAVSLLCAGSAAADTATPAPAHHPKTQIHNQKKTKKATPLPPLANGPTGPVQQIPLDAIAAVPPQVTYQNNQLTIVAPNSTLAEILRAVRKQTGAEIEVPSASERVVTHLGPGPAREVMAELLNGSKFNYVLLGSAVDDSVLTRVVLVAKSREAMPANPPGAEPPPPGTPQPVNIAARQPQDDQAEQNEPDAEDAADDNAEPAAAEVQPVQPDQPPRTPQQMLQEMQQRQMQMQPGQPPFPGGFPGRQPQQQDPQ
jgi:hypothetical protein